MQKRLGLKMFLTRFCAIMLLITGLMTIGACFMANCADAHDPEQDANFFRDIRANAWGLLIGNESGIMSVTEKLKTLYGNDHADLQNTTFSEGNWHYEFAQLAEHALQEHNYLAATGYYSIAAFPHLYADTRADEMYDLALDAFQQALQHGNYPHKIITVTVDGVEIDAYLVYPQSYQTGDVVPVIIETGGTDGLMTFLFSHYLMNWNQSGIAWVGFDLPGNGTSRDLVLTGDNVNSIHVAVINALRTDNSIDSNNIFLHGQSVGGYAALRMLATGKADDLDLAGVAVTCPVGETLWGENMLAVWEALPKLEQNLWGARLGIDASDPDMLAEIEDGTKEMRISEQEFWGSPDTDIPLLVCNTGHDPINPVEEVKEMATISTNGEYVLAMDEYGHCPSRKISLGHVARFVDEHRR